MLCGDEAYRCFGVETGCAEAGESRGVGDAPRRGHTARQSRSERRWETVTGGYGQFAFLCYDVVSTVT